MISSLLCVLTSLLSQWGHIIGRPRRWTESRKAQRREHEKGLECVCMSVCCVCMCTCDVRVHTCCVGPGLPGTRDRTKHSRVLATSLSSNLPQAGRRPLLDKSYPGKQDQGH